MHSHGLGDQGLDLWEAAWARAGKAPAVRICRATLKPWLDNPLLQELVSVASLALDRDARHNAIQAVLEGPQEGEESITVPPNWWLDLLRQARSGRLIEHPAGGVVLVARDLKRDRVELDLFADQDDILSAADREVPLDEHSELVQRATERIAARCLPQELHEVLALAALWHDAGKLDPRFQLLLHQGDEVAAATARCAIAKSPNIPTSPLRRRAVRETSGLPKGFRHEMLSAELARRYAQLPEDEVLADLVLHLIASHHGHGRPFAPVVFDESPPGISDHFMGTKVLLDADDRSSSVPAHRLDSGVAERFWRLTRGYGWWGLAYLEAIVRLADWYASKFALKGGEER